MADPAWAQLVADFCLAHGIVCTEDVSRLCRSSTGILAKREFELGADRRTVRNLLRQAADPLGLIRTP